MLSSILKMTSRKAQDCVKFYSQHAVYDVFQCLNSCYILIRVKSEEHCSRSYNLLLSVFRTDTSHPIPVRNNGAVKS